MVFPYRTPALIEPEPLAHPCTEPYGGHGHCTSTRRFSLSHHCARVEERTPPRPDRSLVLWTKAVSLVALAFLAVSAISMATLAWSTRQAFQLRDYSPTIHHTKVRPTKVRHTTSPPPARRPEAQTRFDDTPHRIHTAASPTAPIFSLFALGRPTHEPLELWARARKLNAAGFDILLTETKIPVRSIYDLLASFPATAKIDYLPDVPGVRISHLPPGALARAFGLQDGDILTAVNGHPLSSPATALATYARFRQLEPEVVEIRRGDRPIVMKVGWDETTR